MKRIVIFIPAFNEEKTIGKLIEKISKLYAEKNYEVKIIVVDDGSADDTAMVAKEAGAKVIRHPYNMGLGAATRIGLQTAYEMNADVAVKTDADLQYLPEDIEKVIQPILDETADVVFGSRFRGTIYYKMPLHRRFGNWFSTAFVKYLSGLNVTDTTTGLIAFSRRYLSRFQLISDYNETQQLILDAWGKRMRIVEVPVSFYPRATGKSFISINYPFRVLPTIMRLFIHSNPLKIFLPLGFLLVLGGLIAGYLVLSGSTTVIGDATCTILVMVGIQIIIFSFIADMVSERNK